MEKIKVNDRQVLGAGWVATVIMTLLLLVAPLMGMPKMDLAAVLGSMRSPAFPAPGSGRWWLGLTGHLINGTLVSPAIYAYWFYPAVPGQPWLKGLWWGLILWLLAETVAMPFMGMGFFSSKVLQPGMAAVVLLIAHIAYGIILGFLVGPQVVLTSEPAEKKRGA